MPLPLPRKKRIALLGVPMDLGADLRGVDMGPSAIRIAGLVPKLASLGHRIQDLGNLTVPHAVVAGKGTRGAKYARPIRKACEELAQVVEKTLEKRMLPLLLGGDHSLSIGSLAGLARHATRQGHHYGLLWVDAHGDCNTAATSPSGNIHGMPVAVALGLGDPALTRLGRRAPMVRPEHTALLAVRSLDPGERENLRRLGVRVFTMREIDEHGLFRCAEEAIQRITRGTDGFHLSFDIDCLDPRFAPGVGTPVSGGLTTREAHLLMELVADTRRMVSCELVEVNPVLDDRNASAELAAYLLYSAFGGRIF